MRTSRLARTEISSTLDIVASSPGSILASSFFRPFYFSAYPLPSERRQGISTWRASISLPDSHVNLERRRCVVCRHFHPMHSGFGGLGPFRRSLGFLNGRERTVVRRHRSEGNKLR